MKDKKLILVTGGTSGIGKETVIALARQGHSVVFTARTRKSGEEALSEAVARSGNSHISFVICDLASFDSIREMCTSFAREHEQLDVLVNNAGVMPQEREESNDGIELNLAVNFLAPFLITNLLLPLIKAAAPSRIVNVSSSLHAEGEIDFGDFKGRSFDKYKAYARSKLAIILFTKKLAKDLSGSGVTVNALHPGVIGTKMTMQNVRAMNPIAAFFFKRTLTTPAEGAETSVYLATAPNVANISGEYFSKKRVVPVSPRANDLAIANRLWDVAAQMSSLQSDR